MKHEILGEGRFFVNPKGELLKVDPCCYKIIKKLLKKDYNELSEEQVDERMKSFLVKFKEAISDTTVKTEKETYTNILKLWYKDGFCHFKTIIDGEIFCYTYSNVMVDTCNNKIDNYPKIETVDSRIFGEYMFNDMWIGDFKIEALYKRYDV